MVHIGFAHHRDLQNAGGDETPREALAQPRDTLLVEHRLDFVRRPGQQHDVAPDALVLVLDPLAGRGAERVGQHLRAVHQVRLAFVIFRHLAAELGKARIELGNEFGIAMDGAPQSGSDTFAGQVILGWTQAAAEDDDLGASERDPRRRREVLVVVADHRLERHIDAEFIEFFGEVKVIGVLEEGREQLGADGNDLGGNNQVSRSISLSVYQSLGLPVPAKSKPVDGLRSTAPIRNDLGSHGWMCETGPKVGLGPLECCQSQQLLRAVPTGLGTLLVRRTRH